MKKFLAVSTMAIFAAGAAMAGGLTPVPADPVPVAPAPVATDWSGFYAGGLAGWMMGDSYNLTVVPATLSGFDGALVGGFAGYNYELDSGFVLGVEGAVSTGTMNFTPPPNLGVTVFDAKVRLGFAAGDALIFASGGYSYATYGNGDKGQGWNLGAGVDYMVTDNFFVGGEYVYRDITDSVATPAAWEDKFSTFQVRVGLKF